MNNAIISTHDTLTAAIEAAGGLNREYNPREFDREVARTEKDNAGVKFYVIEKYGRKEVLYIYQCDIRLINEFSPYGACLNNNDFRLVIIEDDLIKEVTTLPKSARKGIAKLQRTVDTILVANF